MATVHPSRMGLVPQDRDYTHSQHRSRSRARSHDRISVGRRSPSQDLDSAGDRGRRSPKYDEYTNASHPVPWRVQENMYPNRNKDESRYSQGGWAGGDYLTRSAVSNYHSLCYNLDMHSRQQQREGRKFSIWPPSPKNPVYEM